MASTCADAEAERADAVAQRPGAEAQRDGVETQSSGAEAQRADAEAQRADTEVQRADAEAQRAGAETQKANTEAQRAVAEAQETNAGAQGAGAEAHRAAADVPDLSSGPEDQVYLLEEVLSCLICGYAFSSNLQSEHKAMISPCGHRLCLRCADRLETSMADERPGQGVFKGFPCPVCRRSVRKTNLKPCGFIADVIKKRNQSFIPKRCRNCRKRRPVEFRCRKCGLFICKVCSDRHVHPQCEKIGASTVWNTFYCRDHFREILFYCNDCKVDFCKLDKNPEHKQHNTESVVDPSFLRKTEEKVEIYSSVLKGAEDILEADVQQLLSQSEEERKLRTEEVGTQVDHMMAALDIVLKDMPLNVQELFFKHIVDEVGSLAVRMLQAKLREVKYVRNCLEICKDFAAGVVLLRFLDEILEPEIKRLHEDIDLSDPHKIQDRLKGKNVIQHIIQGLTPSVLKEEFFHYCVDHNIETCITQTEGKQRFFNRFGWGGADEYILPDPQNASELTPHLPKSAETIKEKFTEFLRNKTRTEITSCCMGIYGKDDGDAEKLIIDVLPNDSEDCPDLMIKVYALVTEFLHLYQVPEDAIVVMQQESHFESTQQGHSEDREVFSSVAMSNETGQYLVAPGFTMNDAVLPVYPVIVKDRLHPEEKAMLHGCHGFLQSKKYEEEIENNNLCNFPGQAISISAIGPLKNLQFSQKAEKARIASDISSLIGASVCKVGNPDALGEINSFDNYVPVCLGGYLCTGAVEVFVKNGKLDLNSVKEGDVLCHHNSDGYCMLIGTVCKVQKNYTTEIDGAPNSRKVDRVLCALMTNNVFALELYHGLRFDHIIADTPRPVSIKHPDTPCPMLNVGADGGAAAGLKDFDELDLD